MSAARGVLKRPSILVRALVALGLTLALKSVVQALLLRWGEQSTLTQALPPGCVDMVRVRAARRRAWPLYLAASGVPLAVVVVGFSWRLAVMVRRRTQTLANALEQISTGDFTTQLPEPPDSDAALVYGAFHTMRDALATAQRRLAHADAQRRRLFADLTHELATPVSAVLGISDTLAQPSLVPTDEDRARMVALLEGEAVRLERLVGDMRDLAVLDEPAASLDLAPTDVALHARTAVERARAVPLRALSPDEPPRAPKELSFELDAPRGPMLVRADAGRLDQVLTNLLSNAQRHTPSGGTVRVSVRLHAEDGPLPAVQLVVEDSGAGVPEPQRALLGERLFRTDTARDRRTGGHGLGLSIVRSIVEKHRGTLRFDAGPMGGLRATVTLPRD